MQEVRDAMATMAIDDKTPIALRVDAARAALEIDQALYQRERYEKMESQGGQNVTPKMVQEEVKPKKRKKSKT